MINIFRNISEDEDVWVTFLSMKWSCSKWWVSLVVINGLHDHTGSFCMEKVRMDIIIIHDDPLMWNSPEILDFLHL